MKKPMTIADLFATRAISDPQLSPDGQWGRGKKRKGAGR